MGNTLNEARSKIKNVVSQVKDVAGQVASGIAGDYNKINKVLGSTIPATKQISSDIKRNAEKVKSKAKGVLKHHSAEDGKFLADRKKKFGV